MRKWLASLLTGMTLVGCLLVSAYAAEELPMVEITLNGETVSELSACMYGWTSYLPLDKGVSLLWPDVAVTEENGTYTAKAENLTMTAKVGDAYVVVNGRYLYVADRVKEGEEGMPLLPTRVLAVALGAEIQWTGKVEFTTGESPLLEADRPYDEETITLLARVITHESGNQPLEGKMAVGNVILNRVNNSRFPNTVSEVIYQQNQFPGATNAEPNEESILAARLCLEGANVVPDAYYFNGVGKSCWASRNKALVKVIGGHAFYGI